MLLPNKRPPHLDGIFYYYLATRINLSSSLKVIRESEWMNNYLKGTHN
jgi:hypothetical protein